MTSQHDKAKWWRFRVSTLCLTVAVLCTCVGWWSERNRLRKMLELQALQFESKLARQQFENTIRYGTYEERLAAVKDAAKREDIGDAPALIHALTDPDYRIARASRDALRRLSDKPSGFGFPDNPRQDPLQSTVAWQNWKDWFIDKRREEEPDYSLPKWSTPHPGRWSGYAVPPAMRPAEGVAVDDLFADPPAGTESIPDDPLNDLFGESPKSDD